MKKCFPLFICLLCLAGCIAPLQGRPPSPPPPTPPPQAWLLTSAEIEYINLFRVGYTNWGASAPPVLAALVAQYEENPDLINANEWRGRAINAAQRLQGARLWFSSQTPSVRFRPFAARAGAMLAAYQDAGDTLMAAIDRSDGSLIVVATEQAAAGGALMESLGADFKGLLAPSD